MSSLPALSAAVGDAPQSWEELRGEMTRASRLAAILLKCDSESPLGARLATDLSSVIDAHKQKAPPEVNERIHSDIETASLDIWQEYACENWRADYEALKPNIGPLSKLFLTDEAQPRTLK